MQQCCLILDYVDGHWKMQHARSEAQGAVGGRETVEGETVEGVVVGAVTVGAVIVERWAVEGETVGAVTVERGAVKLQASVVILKLLQISNGE